MKLSKRLELVASMVPAGSRIADIGTDHGYIPITLVERGICPSAIAMDVGTGPLARAQAHIRDRGLEGRISTRISDGMAKLKPGEADAVVLAGMGGELVIHILEGGRHLWGDVEAFILSPQSDLEKVRRYLEKNDFQIQKEDMVWDEGKYYTVMLAVRGVGGGKGPAGSNPWWYRYGRYLIQQNHPVLSFFLEKEKGRVEEILERLEGQNTAGAEAAREGLTEELRQIKEAQNEMRGNYRDTGAAGARVHGHGLG